MMSDRLTEDDDDKQTRCPTIFLGKVNKRRPTLENIISPPIQFLSIHPSILLHFTTMRVSLATFLLLSSSAAITVGAFQTPAPRPASNRRVTATLIRRNAVTVDPSKTSSAIDSFFAPPMSQDQEPLTIPEQRVGTMDMTGIALSGLNGQALRWTDEDFPEARQLRAVIPKDCFESNTATSLGYLGVSVAGTALCTALGVALLGVVPPENWYTLPVWALYSAVTGTVAMGLWVLAHECGHGAFSKNKTVQDTVGYLLHSLFLVPYYSWQRSHAVHHQYTNHMELGETHVPEPMEQGPEGGGSSASLKLRSSFLAQFGQTLGMRLWGAMQATVHLVIGWPAYLLIGATGGSDRGMTNHYWPDPLTTPNQPKKELFPGKWKERVFKSDIGVAAVAASAVAWAVCNGLPQMMALYGGPLIVVNAWLVLYTWLVTLFAISWT
jgi:fatty acid desaturase